MTDQKHIEAAAAAYDKEGGMHVGAASIHRLRAAITAYHASLAADGEDGLVRAMGEAFWNVSSINGWEPQMRAALGVVLGAMEVKQAKLQWSHDTLRWLIQNGGKAFYVLGDWWIEWMHNGVEQATKTFNTLEDAMAAARAREGEAK